MVLMRPISDGIHVVLEGNKVTLTRRRVWDRAHRASRSAAQRERVLGYRRGRLASETPDQGTSRLELIGASLSAIETTSKKA